MSNGDNGATGQLYFLDLDERTQERLQKIQHPAAGAVAMAIEELALGFDHPVDSAVKHTDHELKQSLEGMRQAMIAVKGFDKWSQEISPVINLVHEISFQTNALALATLVESTRTGGIGCSVDAVAIKLRALAEYAADLAKEIEQLNKVKPERVDLGELPAGSA